MFLQIGITNKIPENINIMSCTACTKSFGFFTREAGCPNCGFSFCTSCLKKSIAVPRLGHNKPHKVCLNCFDRLTKAKLTPTHASNNTASDEPAAAAVSTSGPLADTASASSIPTAAPALQPANPDDVIQQRLLRLKADQQPLSTTSAATAPTDTDIAVRIAQLKDQQYVDRPAHDPAILLVTDQRTDHEKTADLLKQFAAEAQLDEAADPIKDIERRLAALRGDAGTTAGAVSSAGSASTGASALAAVPDVDVDEKAQVQQLVARFMAEAALDRDGDEAELELTAEELAFVANARHRKADDADRTDSSSQTSESEADAAASDASLETCYICDEDEAPLQRFKGRMICKWCLDSKMYIDHA